MKTLLIVAAIFSTWQSLAQQTIQYLNGDQVRVLAEEGNTMWIGTNGGLVEFDKQSGDKTFYNPLNSGLPDRQVNTIAIGSDGTKWIGTTLGGLATFDGTNWTTYNSQNTPLPGDCCINTIAIDDEGNVWLPGSAGGNLALIEYDGDTWEIHPIGIGSIIIKSIVIDSDDTKWLISNNYLIAFDDGGYQIYPNNAFSGFSTLAVNASGIKWIGTLADGLLAFDGSDWTAYNTSNSGLPSESVRSVAVEDQGTVWIGTDKGLVAFDGTDWTVHNTSNSGLMYDYIGSILIDSDGEKWIGTYEFTSYNGILTVFDGSSWENHHTSGSGLPGNHIRSIATGLDGIKWISVGHEQISQSSDGSDSHLGLASFDGNTWTIYNTTNSGLPDNSISSIVIDQNGTKWMISHTHTPNSNQHELVAFDGSDWTVFNSSNSGLPGDHIYAVATDEQGTKWVGTDKGLVAFDGTTWTVYDTYNSDLPDDSVHNIAIDTEGTVWLGNGPGRLTAYDGNEWMSFYDPTIDLITTALEIDNDGTKWMIGHIWGAPPDYGLMSFDGNTWTVYDAINTGLPGEAFDKIHSISIDAKGTKWVGTENGLISFDGTEWHLYNSSNSALPDYDIGPIAIDEMDTKWIGTLNNGLIVFPEEGSVPAEETFQAEGSESFLIYPNPSDHQLTIESLSGAPPSYIEIIHSNGQVVQYETAGGTTTSLDISRLPDGLYFILLHVRNRVVSQKFLKQ